MLRQSTSIKSDFGMRARSGSIKAMADASFVTRRLRQRLPTLCATSMAFVTRSIRSWSCQIMSTSWSNRMKTTPCPKSCIPGNRFRQKQSTSSGSARELFGRTKTTIGWCAILRSWNDIATTSKKIRWQQSWTKGSSFWSCGRMPQARRLLAPQTGCPRPCFFAPKNSAFPIGSSQLRMVFQKKTFARNESRKTSPLPTAWSIPARRNLKPIPPITTRPTETRTSAAKAVSAKS